MKFDNPLLFFICSIGVFNGFIASFYFLFFSTQKRVQNFLFGLLLLLLSIRIGKSVYKIFTNTTDIDYIISQIGLSACFLIGVSLFYYIKSSVKNIKIIPTKWKIHAVILVLFILVVGLIKPYLTNQEFWHKYMIHIIYGIWGGYIFLSGFLLKNIFSKVFKKEVCTTSELWLIWVFIGNVLIYSAYLVGYFYLYLVGTITFSVVFYVLLIFLLFKNNRDRVFKDIPEKYNSKKIANTEANDLKIALKKTMQEKQFYKDTDIKLKDIAKVLNISSHKLSQFLNDNLGKSFASFINEYRINEAKRLLILDSQYTIEAIGFEAGFSSKSSFYATFKKEIGVTPLEYKKQYS